MSFCEAYGVSLLDDNSNESDVNACLHATDIHSNWYGMVHGACFMTLAIASARKLMGSEAIGVNYSFNFLRGATLGSVLQARSQVAHDGRTMATVHTSVSHGDGAGNPSRADCLLTVDFCRNGNYLLDAPRLAVTTAPTVKPEANGALYRKASQSPRLDISRLFVGKNQKEKMREMHLNGEYTIDLYTNASFADHTGFIDAGAYAYIVDVSAGIAAWSLAGDTPTTQMSLYITKPAKPGAVLTCHSKVMAISGPFVNVIGEIWADDFITATFSTEYFAKDYVRLRSEGK